jgi:eukaryotic-like serine/threonine-protein kinase
VALPHSRLSIEEERFAPYEVVGELGERPIPLYVARPSVPGAGAIPLVVAECFEGVGRAGDARGADFRREARRISTLANPNLARVREVAVRGDDLVVFSDFLDGEKLAHFWDTREWLPLDIALRILLDVLAGVGALHGLRDANQQPMKLTHGEISPGTVLFGVDGVGRLLHSVARRAPEARTDPSSLAYLAPELHSGDARDGRADVFSAGVLLWEALASKRLSNEGDEPAGLRVRVAPLPAPSTPDKAPWSKALVPVVAKALAANPEDRWLTTAALASEIRKAAGLKLAAGSAASAFAKNKFGERVKERRVRWEGAPSSPRSETRPSSRPTAVAVPPVASSRPAGVVLPPVASSRPAAVAASPVVSSPSVASSSSPPVVSSPSVASSPLEVPAVRGEEFSSSMLESLRPPAAPPPSPSLRAPDEALSSSGDVGPFSSDVAPLSYSDLEPPLSFASIAPSAADAVAESGDSASEDEDDEDAHEHEDEHAHAHEDEHEAGPIVAPFGEGGPAPAVLSIPGAEAAPVASRSRRPFVYAAVAAAGIALASAGVHAAHRPSPAATETTQAAAPPPALPSAPSAALPSDSPSSLAAAASPPGSSSAGSAKGTAPGARPTKAVPKAKGPGVGAAHAKSAGVRPATHAKPGGT